jgi:hypothetical protein
MNRRIPVEPSPISGLLQRLQTNAGWGSFVSDDLKQRMIRQLERIALDDTVSPATQVAAIACSMKASSLELETVNTLVRLYEATELERRVDELCHRLDPPATEPDFLELEPLDDQTSEQPTTEQKPTSSATSSPSTLTTCPTDDIDDIDDIDNPWVED